MKLERAHPRRQDYGEPVEPLWRITMMRKSGIYPRCNVITPTSAFSATDDCAFMVAPVKDWPEELPYSEVMWLNAEELRLLGSMMMTERFDGGQRCSFRPVPSPRLYIRPFPLNHQSVAKLRELILTRLAEPDMASLCAIAIAPHHFGGCFPAAYLQTQLRESYWGAIASDSYLVLRAIYALIKSDMLALEYEFREEAIINTFVALDASFQLVLRHLTRQGHRNPGSKDAGDWMYRTFDERLGLAQPPDFRYFQEFYDNRIRTLHPASRLGDFPYAPLAADDYSHLRSVLPGVIGYLLTETHTPEFEDLFRQVATRGFVGRPSARIRYRRRWITTRECWRDAVTSGVDRRSTVNYQYGVPWHCQQAQSDRNSTWSMRGTRGARLRSERNLAMQRAPGRSPSSAMARPRRLAGSRYSSLVTAPGVA